MGKVKENAVLLDWNQRYLYELLVLIYMEIDMGVYVCIG